MTSPERYRIQLRGGLPGALLEELRARFDLEQIATGGGAVVMTGRFDQSSLRALLGLIWDGGGAAVSVTAADDQPAEATNEGKGTHGDRSEDAPERS